MARLGWLDMDRRADPMYGGVNHSMVAKGGRGPAEDEPSVVMEERTAVAEATRDAGGRFTSAGASLHGRQGAKERERRLLERHVLPATHRAKQRAELSSAIALVQLVYGPRWRPRRVPRHEREMTSRLPEVIGVLQEALEAEQNAQRLRAAQTLLYVWSRLDALLGSPNSTGATPRAVGIAGHSENGVRY